MNPKNRVHWLVMAQVLAGLIGSGVCEATRGYNLPALTAQPCLFATAGLSADACDRNT